MEVEQPLAEPINGDPMGDWWVYFDEPFFRAGTNPKRFESVKTWTHEFTEISLLILLKKMGHELWDIQFIDPLRRFRYTSVPHVVTSLHTRSYIDERERTPDEYAKETIKKFRV